MRYAAGVGEGSAGFWRESEREELEDATVKGVVQTTSRGIDVLAYGGRHVRVECGRRGFGRFKGIARLWIVKRLKRREA